MPHIKTRPPSTSPSTSPSPFPSCSESPSPGPSSPSVSIIHLSVAQVLASGRAYTGRPPLGPLALPSFISYTIVDSDPQLPLRMTPGELYATVDGELRKIRLIADCEEGQAWRRTAEGFQGGSKTGGRVRVKVEDPEEEEEEEGLGLGLELRHNDDDDDDYDDDDGDNSTKDLSRDKSDDTREDAKKDTKRKKAVVKCTRGWKRRRAASRENTPAAPSPPPPPPRETKRRRLRRRAVATTTTTSTGAVDSDTLVLPDLVPDEVELRKAEATLKNEALKRGLGLKSLLPYDHGKKEVLAHDYDKGEEEEEEEEGQGQGQEDLAHNRNKAEDLAIAKLSGCAGPARKTVKFARRLMELRKVLREAMEGLTESNLEQLEPYFEVDWMIEDIEAAVQGAISRKNLTDRAKGGKGFKSYPSLGLFAFPSIDDLPFASKNQKATELMVRLTPLVTTLWRAVEVLSEPYLLEIERLFDVDWMIEDVCRAVTGAISCRRLNERILKRMH